MGDKVLTGVCAWFNARTGYGFITKDDGTGDIFVHWSNLAMDGFKVLKQGQVVSFEVGENHHGAQAVNVKILKEAPKK